MEDQKPEKVPEAVPQTPVQEPKPSVKPEPPVSGPLSSFEAWLYDMLVVKAPYQLPKAAKEWIVRYSPWITLVIGVILALTVIPVLMAAMAVSSYSSAVLGSVYSAAVATSVGPMFYLSLAVLAVQLVVMFMSVPMLLKRQRKGWMLVFYSNIVSLVYSVFNTFTYGYFNIGSLFLGLLSAAVGLYVIFQVRSYYKS